MHESHQVTEGERATLSGATYICWGERSCPDVQGTELVYSGTVINSVNGANYGCLPNNPTYYNDSNLSTVPMDRVGMANHTNVDACFGSCAVCYTSIRSTVLMIPGKLTCPGNWTTEYTGFLMTDINNHSQHVCIDESLSCNEHTNVITPETLLIAVQERCNNCPEKPLTCIVCSR